MNRAVVLSIPVLSALVLLTLGSPTLAVGDSITAIPDDGAQTQEIVSMDECVRLARTENSGFLGESARLAEVKGQGRQTISEALPSVDITGAWSRSRDPSFALDETFGGGSDDASSDSTSSGFLLSPTEIPAQTYWRTSIDARWELNPGRIYNAIAGIGLTYRRQEEEVRARELDLIQDVLVAYDAVWVAGEALNAVESEMMTRSEALAVSRRRFQLDLATSLDTLQAAVSLANMEPERRRASQHLRDAGADLNILIGREPDQALTIEDTPTPPSVSLDDVGIKQMLEDRPDLTELRLAKRVLQKTRGARKSSHRPYLTLEGSYGFVGRDLETLTDDGHDFWSTRVALSIPVFDGFLTKGRVWETEASIVRTDHEIDEASRRAFQEVSRIQGELDAARQSLEASRLNADRAELLVTQMTQRYELGKAEYLEVLTAQSDRFQARSELIRARSDVFTLTVALKRALGLDPSLPFPGDVQ